jgi:hypoxanthine phosphoribosyltransferase
VRGAGFQPEVIVAIGRGGYMPARIVSDYLAVHKERFARIRYPLTAETAGKRVLLVDDVSDSGDTFEVAIAHLRERGAPAELRTAVLHQKTVSRFTPDFCPAVVRERHGIEAGVETLEDGLGMPAP